MKRLIGIVITIIIVTSCAKEAPSVIDGDRDVIFRTWISKYAPNATHLNEDIYIEFFERGTTNPDLKPNLDSSWVELRYTGRTLDGTIFITRSEQISRQLGRWIINTHWCDDFAKITPYEGESTLNSAFIRGLLEMHEGDSARIYIPAKHGYSANSSPINTGYLGESTSYANAPIYFDVRLIKIVNNTEKYELDLVNKYASEKWGMTLSDTLVGGLYMRKTLELPHADTIPHKDTVKIHMTEYFLDDFIIKTTSDSIANIHRIYQSTESYLPIGGTIDGTDDAGFGKLFINVMKKMKFGEEADIICTSPLTDKGTSGDAAGKPQINPYTPRLYKIIVLPPKDEEEEE